MTVKAYKTKKINPGDDIYKIFDYYLPEIKENSIVAVTSKIVSLSQRRVVKKDGRITRFDLAKKESQYYLPERFVKYGVHLTVTNNILIASAGIDESNTEGYWVLWPKDVLKDAENIWNYLKNKNNIKNLGVVITDSHLMPLRRGVTGLAIAWCGFRPLRNYIGTPDIFGHNLKVTKTNVADGLAQSAVLIMGEGNEQTPLVVIEELNSVEFLERAPSQKEISEMRIPIEDDIYSALLTSIKWEMGKGRE